MAPLASAGRSAFLGLGLLFRYAPSRDHPPWRWVACSTVAAVLLWIAASVEVSLYVAHIASLGHFYGSLGSVAVVLLWFYAGALAILAGAEIDAVLTARDQGQAPTRLKSDPRQLERAS